MGVTTLISPDAEMCLWVRKATRTDSTSGLAIVMRACFAETQARHRRCAGGGGGGRGQGGSSLGWDERLALPGNVRPIVMLSHQLAWLPHGCRIRRMH